MSRGRCVGSKHDDEGLIDVAPIAVVKRGRKGATVLMRDGKRVLRFEVATSPIRTADTTGAGDAFSAGFLHGWLDARRRGSAPSAALQRGAVAGNRAALRHLSTPRPLRARPPRRVADAARPRTLRP